MSDSLNPDSLRVHMIESPRGVASDVSLRRTVSAPAGQEVEVRFQGRAQSRRAIFVRLGEPNPTSQGTEVVLGAQRSEFQLSFRAPADSNEVTLSFDLASEMANVEIANVRMLVAGKSVPLSNLAPSVTLVRGEVVDGAGASEAPTAPTPPPSSQDSQTRHKLFTHEGAKAAVRELAAEGDVPARLRLEIANPGTKIWHIQFAVPCPPIEVGKECEVKIRVRADKERKIAVAASRSGPDDWSNVGLYQTRSITPQWQELLLKFQPSLAEAKPRIQFDVGGDASAIEIGGIVFRTQDQSVDLMALPPPAAPKAPSTGPAEAAGSPWKLSRADGGEARLEMLGDDGAVMAVRIANPGNKIYSVQLNRTGLTFRKGSKCELSMELRASQPRTAAVAVSHSGAKNSELGLYSKRELSTEWKKYSFPFRPTEDSDSARVHLDLGQSPGDVEIRDVQLTVDGSRTALGPGPSPPAPSVRTTEDVAPSSPSPPQKASAASSALLEDWQFSSEGVKAMLTVRSLAPWHAEMVVEPPSSPEGRALLRRGIRSSQAPFVLRVQGKPLGPVSGPAKVELRLFAGTDLLTTKSVDLSENWRDVTLATGPGSVQPDRIEVIAPSPMVVGVSESQP